MTTDKKSNYSKFLVKIKAMDSKNLSKEITNISNTVKEERKKPLIKRNYDMILGLEAQKSDMEMELVMRKNREFIKRKQLKNLEERKIIEDNKQRKLLK